MQVAFSSPNLRSHCKIEEMRRINVRGRLAHKVLRLHVVVVRRYHTLHVRCGIKLGLAKGCHRLLKAERNLRSHVFVRLVISKQCKSRM
jgi:hypothetical protein